LPVKPRHGCAIVGIVAGMALAALFVAIFSGGWQQ
jgi:hypothetical protein